MAAAHVGGMPHRFFIFRGDGEYRVVPPMPVVRAGETVTWVNTTQDRVVLLLPAGLMAGGFTGEEIQPQSPMQDPPTIDANARGAYYYIVAVVQTGPNRIDKATDHGFVLAQGNSSPGMMVDY